MDNLRETTVQAALQTRWLGHTYYYRAETGSTNERLKRWLSTPEGADLPHGTVLLTDHQTQGRGRLDRRWHAPPGTSLLFSVLLRPHWPAERQGWLTMIAGLAAAEAIEALTDVTVALKWPNDVMLFVGGAWRKTAGILLEGSVGADGHLQHAVLGIGINVNISPEALPEAPTPATSLLAASGRSFSRLDLLSEVLSRLEALYDAAAYGYSPAQEWERRLLTVGQDVEVTRPGAAPLTGEAEGTDAWGNLLVRDAAGTLHTIAAGDVTLRRKV